jgi:putative hydrolase of the HAD superfamily
MRFDAVVFDLFGTLVDIPSIKGYRATMAAMAGALGIGATDFESRWRATRSERFIGHFGTIEANIRHICQSIALPVSDAAVAAACRAMHELDRRNLIPRPDAAETLARLKASGYLTGLISGCSPGIPALWPETPLASLVDAAVFSCLVGVRKPDERIYRHLCEQLAVEPGRCLYVGDGDDGELTGAAHVGLHPVLIRVPYEVAADSHRVAAEDWPGPRISSLGEVLTLL